MSEFENKAISASIEVEVELSRVEAELGNYEIKWKVIDRARVFNPINRRCGLCTKEKFYIIFQPEGASLNQRSEIFSTCRHRLRKLLANT